MSPNSSSPNVCDFELEGHCGAAYNEQAFQYFLGIERKRSGRSSRPFALLLVDLQKGGEPIDFHSELASKVFSGLSSALRETDFIGWYREDRVAGAVLTHLGDASLAEAAPQVRQRISDVLGEAFRADEAPGVHVRIYQLPNQVDELFKDRS